MDQDRWKALCARLRCEGASERLTILAAAYGGRHRFYHTGQHVAECLAVFDAVPNLTTRPSEMEWAIWLHDVVYRPTRSDNEKRSADLSASWLARCAGENGIQERVRSLIMATRHDERAMDPDEALIQDVDLHVLGAPPARYDEYEKQIRQEYRWVPQRVFRKGRAAILARLRERDPLFRHEWFRERYEQRARSNLDRALAALSGQRPSAGV